MMDYMFANYIDGSLRLQTYRHVSALATTWEDIRDHIEDDKTEVKLTADIRIGSEEYNEIMLLLDNNCVEGEVEWPWTMDKYN